MNKIREIYNRALETLMSVILVIMLTIGFYPIEPVHAADPPEGYHTETRGGYYQTLKADWLWEEQGDYYQCQCGGWFYKKVGVWGTRTDDGVAHRHGTFTYNRHCDMNDFTDSRDMGNNGYFTDWCGTYTVTVANQYTVSYDMNNGVGSISNQSCTYDKSFNISSYEPTKVGCEFLGWSTDSNATVPTYAPGESVSNLTSVHGGVVTLYAVWKELKYTITLDANGGILPENNTWIVTFGLGTNNDLSSLTTYREEHIFDGWWDDAAGGETVYDKFGKAVADSTYWDYDSNWKYPGDVTLYAHWQYAPSQSGVDLTQRDLRYFWSTNPSVQDTNLNAIMPNYYYTNGADNTSLTTLPEATGTYYLFVHAISDIAGNVSSEFGVVETTLDGEKWHKFGPYNVDNTCPTISFGEPYPSGEDIMVPVLVSDEHSKIDVTTCFYYLSTSADITSGGTWTAFTPDFDESGVTGSYDIRINQSGEWFIWLKNVYDNAGNPALSDSNGDGNVDDEVTIGGSYNKDSLGPIVEVTPTSVSWTNQDIYVDIRIYDQGSSGLADDNIYEYYISESNITPIGGSNGWISFSMKDFFGNPVESVRVAFRQADGSKLDDGEYYLIVRAVLDNCGNVSSSSPYHVFGSYQIDTGCPFGTVRYYETPYTLMGESGKEPYSYMLTDDAVDIGTGINEIFLFIYDKSNPYNSRVFPFYKSQDLYRVDFNLYSDLRDYENVEQVGILVIAEDMVGNYGTLEIAFVELGDNQAGEAIQSDSIDWTESENCYAPEEYALHEERHGYFRNSFRVLPYIYSINNDTRFLGGGFARLKIYTFGNVEALSTDMPGLASYIDTRYDESVDLPLTAIPNTLYSIYEHEFYVPLYAHPGCYDDGVVRGFKGNVTTHASYVMNIEGTILDEFRTILRYGK